MTVTTNALIPALQDARSAHAAVIDRFRADMAVIPHGPHRRTLEHHLADIQEHIARIDDHLRAIRPRHLVYDTVEIFRTLASGLGRAVQIPLEAGAVIADGILRGARPATDRQLLRTTECEYGAAAQARAACRAGESIAALADDEKAMDLLGALRRHDELLLESLDNSIEQLALALADAAAADGPWVRADDAHAGAAARLSGLEHHQSWRDHRPPADGRVGSRPTGTGLGTIG
ncbi:hypothetical protein AAW14_04300 [Streptomyces hygroscopicus]|uniref:hypothetical protein n=1 Tax=Streptomyces hygroscopicus TaxID=1912 RepID=UPI00223EBFDD|nr:hypothetical protein [Streptomyces hygroscopicus]MCW7941292.1 hypothetical protein [Streptomyces hygroscopicus]